MAAQDSIQARFLRHLMQHSLAAGGDLPFAFGRRQLFGAGRRSVMDGFQMRFWFHQNPQRRLTDRTDAMQFQRVGRVRCGWKFRLGRDGRIWICRRRRGRGCLRALRCCRGFFRLRAVRRFHVDVGNFFRLSGHRRNRAGFRRRRWNVGHIAFMRHANERRAARTGDVFAGIFPVALDMLAAGRTLKLQFFHGSRCRAGRQPSNIDSDSELCKHPGAKPQAKIVADILAHLKKQRA
jgi:hypothetical protein